MPSASEAIRKDKRVKVISQSPAGYVEYQLRQIVEESVREIGFERTMQVVKETAQ